jgi:Bacterial regulatory proteins, luxR family
MATSLTRDERRVLQLLVSGKGSEEIAAALDLPPQVVRAHAYALITRMLGEREGSTTRSPSANRVEWRMSSLRGSHKHDHWNARPPPHGEPAI